MKQLICMPRMLYAIYVYTFKKIYMITLRYGSSTLKKKLTSSKHRKNSKTDIALFSWSSGKLRWSRVPNSFSYYPRLWSSDSRVLSRDSLSQRLRRRGFVWCVLLFCFGCPWPLAILLSTHNISLVQWLPLSWWWALRRWDTTSHSGCPLEFCMSQSKTGQRNLKDVKAA